MPIVNRKCAGDAIEQRRLSRTIRADQRHKLARLQRKIDPPQRMDLVALATVEIFVNLFQLQHYVAQTKDARFAVLAHARLSSFGFRCSKASASFKRRWLETPRRICGTAIAPMTINAVTSCRSVS